MNQAKEKATKLVLTSLAVTLDFEEGHYGVTSGSRAGVLHHVNVEHGTCSCEQFTYRHQCGHVALAAAKAARDAALLQQLPAWEVRLVGRAAAPVPTEQETESRAGGARGLLEAFGVEV